MPERMRSADDQGRRAYRSLVAAFQLVPARQKIFFLFLCGTYAIVLSQLSFYISPYGDAKVYVFGDWPAWFTHQPLYPLTAGAVRRVFGLDAVYGLNILLYAGTMAAAWFVGRRISPSAGYVLCSAILLNARSYFYVTNPLTEVMYLFLFFLAALVFAHWNDWANKFEKVKSIGLLSILLVLFCLVRGPNPLILLIMLGLCLIAPSGRIALKRRLCLALCATFVVVTGYTAFAQRTKSAVGLSLHAFVEIACARQKCPEKIFAGDDTPYVQKHFREKKTISGIRDTLARDGHGPFSSTYANEMRAVFLKLIWNAPSVYLSQVAQNWRDIHADRSLGIYPEDPNLKLFEQPRWLVWASASTYFSTSMLALTPIFIIIGIVQNLRGRASMVQRWATGAMLGCLSASLLIYAVHWVTDGSRLRFHFEFATLLAILCFVGGRKALVEGAVAQPETRNGNVN